MTQKYLLPIPSTLDTDRAKALMEKVRRRVAEGKITSYADLVRETMAIMEDFYTNLSAPVTQARTVGENVPRDPAEFNEFCEEVRADLEAGFNTARTLSDALVTGFNYTSSLVAQLEARVQKMAGRSQDLQHATQVFTEDVIVVGDEFVDNSKVDAAFQVSGENADILIGSGSMLHRDEALAVSDDAIITLGSNYPVYEGKFYALAGEAEPEGGRFHFTSSSSPSGSSSRIERPTGDTFEDTVVRESLDELSARDATTGVISERAETDAGAPEDDKKKVRAVILDGNPDTYWQAELVLNIPTGTPTTGEEGSRSENNEGIRTDGEITYEALVDYLSTPGVDKIDLEVILTMQLKAPAVTNFIVLDPLQAGDGAWLEVVDIQTSMDRSTWESLEGMHDHNFENILTDEANEELTDREVGATLAPNKYQYMGKGVWTFPAREARFIRVTLRQRVPVPAPYDIMAVELQQTVTDTTTKERNKSFLTGIFG